jgi:NAD(P)-dependent dehydrogenase (short-subunit alcohol dehydrogenase family)
VNLDIAEKTFVITGGTDGLGFALAQRLLDEGAQVAVCGRDEERLDAAQRQLGNRALVVQADVTVAPDCEALVAATLDRFGAIHGLVNNAGRAAAGLVADSHDDQWRDDYELKVVAAVRMSRLTLPALIDSRGAILNVLAVMARAPHAGSMPTGASRAAGLAATKALAAEVGPAGVRVNAVLIGLIASGQWVRRAAEAGLSEQTYYDTHPQRAAIALGRFGHRDEFADVAAFLLSPRASYVTGVGLALDGGLSPVI